MKGFLKTFLSHLFVITLVALVLAFVGRIVANITAYDYSFRLAFTDVFGYLLVFYTPIKLLMWAIQVGPYRKR